MATITCNTTLQAIGTWIIAHVSQAASAQLPSRGQVMVKGTINGVPFQRALEPDGRSGHWFALDDSLQAATGAKVGDTVTLVFAVTKDWPEPDIPADWQAALDADDKVLALWQRITPMARWEWLRWINSTAEPTTRQRRIEVSCSKLLAGNRRPCCFNRNMCCVPQVCKSGVLLTIANDDSSRRY